MYLNGVLPVSCCQWPDFMCFELLVSGYESQQRNLFI